MLRSYWLSASWSLSLLYSVQNFSTCFVLVHYVDCCVPGKGEALGLAPMLLTLWTCIVPKSMYWALVQCIGQVTDALDNCQSIFTPDASATKLDASISLVAY